LTDKWQGRHPCFQRWHKVRRLPSAAVQGNEGEMMCHTCITGKENP
jgi:hypothetical protein